MTETLVLEIPESLWMTANGRIHHHDRARRTRGVRQLAEHAARAAALPHYGQVFVAAFIGYSTNRKADPANAYPTVKAALDGLTDAGVWPDDDSTHVVSLSFLREQRRRAPRGTHTIRLELVDQCIPWLEELR